MASVFKRKRKVKLASGKTVTKQSQKWHVKYTDADGIERRVTAYKDKTASQQLAARLEKEAELAKAGVVDRFKESRSKALSEHLDDFLQSLTDRGRSAAYAKLTHSRARTVLSACDFRSIGDVKASAVERYLGERKTEDLGTESCNHYLTALKNFFNWMVRDCRIAENPLEHLKKAKSENAIQRALEPDEARTLLEATGAARKRFGMMGYERNMLYRLAIETGLRANEIRSLKVSSFDLDSRTVTVERGGTKNKKLAVLPLRANTALELKEFFSTKMPSTKGFNLPNKFRMADMLRADLTEAGIRCSDKLDSPDYINFHSLRHTTGTLLAACGVHPKVAQSIMRHSDINLTMSRYTHTLLGQEAKAVESLPDLSLPSGRSEKVAATGTDGKPSEEAKDAVEELTPQLTPTAYSECNQLATDVSSLGPEAEKVEVRKHLPKGKLDTNRNPLSPHVSGRGVTRPAGLEPATYGLEIRCSIQLSYGRFISKCF